MIFEMSYMKNKVTLKSYDEVDEDYLCERLSQTADYIGSCFGRIQARTSCRRNGYVFVIFVSNGGQSCGDEVERLKCRISEKVENYLSGANAL